MKFMYNIFSKKQPYSITEKMESDLSNDLCDAIQKDDLCKVIDLISKGANVNACNNSDKFPLQIAIKKKSMKIIEELIQKGANVNIKVYYENQNIPLVEYAMVESNENIVTLLIEKDASLTFNNNNEEKVLHYVIKNGLLELLKQLINKGININLKINEDETPLIIAVKQGQLEIVIFLCKMGADINTRTSRNSTPLHFAVSCPVSFEITEFLINNGAEIDAENVFGYTPLQCALYDKNFRTAKLLVEKGANINRIYINTHYARQRLGGTLLHWASRNWNSDELMKFLITNGADINATERDGRTPLCLLVKHNGTSEMVTFFVKNGADLNNKGGGSPLYWAIYCRDIRLQTLLIELGTDVNSVIDSHDHLKAPLHLVHNLSVVKLLIDKGANVNITDKSNSTPLHYANHLSIVKCLVENGADINAKNSEGNTPLHTAFNFPIVEYLVEKGVDVNIPNFEGYTPLHFVKNVIIAEYLIEQGANIKAVTKDGKSVLHSIIEINTYIDINFTELPNLVYFLIEKGINIDITDNNGDTPLHLCGTTYNNFTAKILIENGANISATNIENKKPIDLNNRIFGNIIISKNKLFTAVNENASWKSIESLLFGGVNLLNIPLDNLKTNVLHYMAQYGHESIVKNLFKHLRYRGNVNFITKYKFVNAQNINNWMPLHYAALRGNESIVKYLLDNGAIYNAETLQFETPIKLTTNDKIKSILQLSEKIFEYVKVGDETEVAKCIQIQKELINAKENNGNSLLHVAICHDHTDITMLLLNHKADFTQINNTKHTTLHFATFKGMKDIIAILLTNAEKTRILNEFINLKTTNGMTALHMAAKNNFIDLVKLLLSHGAIYNEKNKEGKIPMDLSMDKDIIDYLKFVQELFEDAKYGKIEIIHKLQNLDCNEFKTITTICNRQGYTLKDIMKFNGYDCIIQKFLEIESTKSISVNVSKKCLNKYEDKYSDESDQEDLGFGLFD
ncbi:ankyrin-1-like isoform X2 [Vespa crabro]|uniref:ankyrin-1-like isoform X2 n=1 Tax=Vespa crabro TaxID=7445 RepID=UPI001F031808|nr:ankyrin-1-like isoform X2 [Vespa crabro]